MRECLKQFVNQGIDVLSNLSKQASCFMNLWYIIIVIRIVSIYSVGNDLYSDERGSFQCATKQFLCRTGCHDQFMPIKLTHQFVTCCAASQPSHHLKGERFPGAFAHLYKVHYCSGLSSFSRIYFVSFLQNSIVQEKN